jgi:hypothetical protein
MAENKTKPTTVSPRSFINQVDNEQKRKDCHELVALMQEITGHPPKMWGASIVGFDQYHYKYASGRAGDSLLTGFAPRKDGIVLYLGPDGIHDKTLMKRLGKHKVGQGCLYVKKLDDVDREVLRDLIVQSVKAMRKRALGSN